MWVPRSASCPSLHTGWRFAQGQRLSYHPQMRHTTIPILFLALVLTSISRASAPRPFEAQQRTARDKLRLLKASSPDLRAAAAQELVGLVGTVCTEALPVLARRVRVDRDVNVRLWAVRSLAQIAASCDRPGAEKALQPAKQDASPDVRDEANRALRPAHPTQPLGLQLAALKAAGVARPRTLTVTEGRPGWTRLRKDRLQPLAKRLVPALTRLLGHRDSRVRAGSALVLGELGPQARPATAALARALKDRQPVVAVAAAGALTTVGALPRPSLTLLLEALKSGAWDVRRAVALALGKVSARPKIVAALIRALSDPIDQVAAAAAAALGRLSPGQDEATRKAMVQALGQAIASGGFNTRVMGLDALGAFKAAAAPAAPQIVSCLRHPVRRVQETALWCVAQLGRAIGARAIAPLRRLLKDKDPTLRRAAADTLGQLGPMAAPAVPGLMALLRDRDPQIRSVAVVSLGQIGPPARRALPALKALLKDPAVERSWVTRAMESIGKRGR
jgi:HEAT repeat protein